MKSHIERIFASALAFSFLFVACTEEEQTPAPNFPDAVTEWLDLSDNENSYTLVINPNQDWTVSIPSSAADYWAIQYGAQRVLSVGGTAGENRVEIVCLASEQDLEEHSVDVSLTMGGETRVIATIILRAGETVFSVKPAVIVTDEDGVHRKFADPSADTGYNYSYGESLGENDAVEMLWDASSNSYVTYVLVEANFNWTTGERDGLRVRSLNNGSTNARTTELEIVCSTVNYPATGDKTYSLELTSSVEDYESVTIPVSVPPFVPVLEVKAALPNDEGNDFQIPSSSGVGEDTEDSPYNWLYGSALESGDKISMIWRPTTSVSVVDTYILVRSNFTFSIQTASDWLTVGEAAVVEETSTAYETESVYHLSVASSVMTAESMSGTFSIGVGEYSEEFDLQTPDMNGRFYIANAPTLEFSSTGVYSPSTTGATTTSVATVDITSSDRVEDIRFLHFALADGAYAEITGDDDWISQSWPEYPNSTGAIVTNTLTVSVQPNDGEYRQGLLMAFPQSVYEKLPSDRSGLFTDDGNVADEYSDYVVATIHQTEYTEDTGIISPVDQNMWQYEQSKFEVLAEDPSGNGIADCYRITYAVAADEGTVINDAGGVQIRVAAGTRITGFRAEDMDGNNVDLDENCWLQVVDDGSGLYHITMAPAGVSVPELYVIFVSNNNDVALIHCIWDTSAQISDIDLSLIPGLEEGFTFTRLANGSPDIPTGMGAGAYYLLEYDGTSDAVTGIQGIPLDIRSAMVNPVSVTWLSATYMNGRCSVNFKLSAGDMTDEAYINFYDANSMIPVCVVCRVASASTGDDTETVSR